MLVFGSFLPGAVAHVMTPYIRSVLITAELLFLSYRKFFRVSDQARHDSVEELLLLPERMDEQGPKNSGCHGHPSQVVLAQICFEPNLVRRGA